MKASTKATRTKMSPLSQRKTYLLDTYAAQCGKCYKWRSIDSQEEYEEIRYEAPRKSFECKTSCEEPGDVDVECDSAKVWFVDYLHGLPKTPQGLQRIVVVRESRNRCDVYYVTPQGKRLRNYKQVNDFIQDKKGFQYTNMEDITFSQPKLLKKTKLSHDKEIKSSSDALSIKEKDATLKKKSNTREETTERKKQVMDKNINKEAGTKHPPESEILSNEVIIEEIEKGKLDGKLAVKGKKISILYTGKLKDSGKVFDSTLGEGEAPLRFLIGGEKVIQGLSIGVEGMRVGDKRRIIIPPSLGYAEEGLNEVVPENAWLVYEVEAVKCR